MTRKLLTMALLATGVLTIGVFPSAHGKQSKPDVAVTVLTPEESRRRVAQLLHQTEPQKYQVAVAALRAGRYHEARRVLEGNESVMEWEILQLIQEALRQRKAPAALPLYKALFTFFPLGARGEAGIENERNRWQKRVLDYARILSTSPLAEDRRLAAEERRAAPLFSAFIKARNPQTARQAWEKMRQLVSQCPRSVFTVAAISQSGSIYWWSSDIAEEGGMGLRFFLSALKSLEKANAPKQHRLIVLSEISLEADDAIQRSAARSRIVYDAHRQIEKLSELPSEKAEALLNAAKALPGTEIKDASAHSRALFHEVIQKYPKTQEATEARRNIVESWLSAKQTDKALQAVYRFERSAPVSEVAGLLLRVAYHRGGETDNPKALPVLGEIARRFPRQGAAAESHVQIAAIHGKRGDEAKMLALYEKVAALEKKDIDGGEMYMQSAQSTAIARLGDYYMKREQWEEALKWWRGWKSASFCGNCADSLNSANAFRIYNCLMKLGREDEAIQTLEEWTLKPHIESGPSVPIALVEHHRARGVVSALQARLRAALEKNNYLSVARMALDYSDLLQAKERKDIATLWQPFEKKSHRTLEYLNWREKYAGKFLVELGEVAKPFLLEKARSPHKNDEDETSDASAWACLLLAKMQAEEVLPILREKLKRVQNVGELKYRFWALALLDTPVSRAILEQQAQNGKGQWQALARKIIELYPDREAMRFLDDEERLLDSGPPLEKYWESYLS